MKKIINKKLNYKIILKYIFVFALIYMFSKAEIYDCSPFSISLIFALFWTGFNVWILSFEYFSCAMLLDFSLQSIYITITIIFVLVMLSLIHKKIKKPLNLPVLSVYCVIAQTVNLYYMLEKNLAIAKIVAYLVLLLVSFYLFVLVFQLLLLRGLYYKLTLNEAVAIVYMLTIFGLGLSSYCFYEIELLKLIAIAGLIFLNLIKKKTEAFYFAVSLGLGYSLLHFDYLMLANLAVLSIVINIFAYPHKYKMFLTLMLSDLVFGVYFLGFTTDILALVFPTIIMVTFACFLPNKLIEKVQNKFYLTENEMNMRNIVSITRKNLHKRFNELANVFNEMKSIHLNLIKQELTEDQVITMLSNDTLKGLCKDCLDKHKCFKGASYEEKSVVAKLVELALKKGKISLLDIPSTLAIRCPMINLLIGRVNQVVSQYGQFVNAKKGVNNVKYLLAEQLGAVSQIMLDLGDELDKNISFDCRKESLIVNELLAENIVCSEIVIYSENNENTSVNLTIKGDNAYNPKLEEIVSKKLKTKMKVNKVTPVEINGFYSVNLLEDNSYDLIFGLTNCTKQGSEMTGDSHSLIRLPNNRFLIALCDGMGSGETANRTSALTIGLIENFYKAGFDNDIIISSVNKLLAINNQESYATLDLCLLDLNKETVDFVKIGSPYSVIKHEGRVEKIEGGALPIGVLETINPKSYTTTIDTKSMIIMATDGVMDAFKEVEDFADFVEKLVSTNPQTIAETIMDEAIRRNDNLIKDDMTVLVTRTFKKNN